MVGQLTGACGFDVGDPCASAANATIDGAFASYFADVAEWLDAPCVISTEECDNGLDDDAAITVSNRKRHEQHQCKRETGFHQHVSLLCAAGRYVGPFSAVSVVTICDTPIT